MLLLSTLVPRGWNRSHIRRVVTSLGLSSLLLVVGRPAWGGAIYNGQLSMSVTMPPAQTNTFGFAGPSANFDGDSFAVGNANAVYTPGTFTRFPSPPPVGGTANNVTINGQSNQPFGLATSDSQGVIGANLGNLTGGPPPTPPAQVLVVPFSYSFAYSISTHVDDPLYDFAEATVHLSISLGGAQIDSFDKSVKNNDPLAAGTINKTLMLSLPANSVTALRIDFYVTGIAVSTAPPVPVPQIPPPLPTPLPYPIPEPSSVVLGSIALVCIARIGVRFPLRPAST